MQNVRLIIHILQKPDLFFGSRLGKGWNFMKKIIKIGKRGFKTYKDKQGNLQMKKPVFNKIVDLFDRC